MGYTHYWRQMDDCDQLRWSKITDAAKLLLANLPPHTDSAGGAYSNAPLVVTRQEDDPSPPEVTGELIAFNGYGHVEGAYDLGHETFVLTRVRRELDDYEKNPILYIGQDGKPVMRQEGVFDFCKTARKPYDLAVCAVLIVAANVAPDVWQVSSDGDPAEWRPALDFANRVVAAKAEDLGIELPLRMPAGVHRETAAVEDF